MPVVRLRPDTLDEENQRFAQAPLGQPVFLNSVPKCGSHLLRNIMRMFVPVEQHYSAQFIQFANLEDHLEAFESPRNFLSWGHLLFSDASAIETGRTRRILLVRDPYAWVLARARFFLSEEFDGNVEFLKDGKLGVGDLLNLMIFGIHRKAPSLAEIFQHNAAAWLGTGACLVRYEELAAMVKTLETPEAEAYFAALLDAAGIALPPDWRERVRIGADRKQSATASENLTTLAVELPGELPEAQKRLVDYAAPGLRSLLGYG
jgi:hypothetical protein